MERGPSSSAPVLVTTDAVQPLSPAESARLTEFARACKAAARAVALYPDGHPAVAATLTRLVQITSAEAIPGSLRIDVLADGLQIGGRPSARPDAALAELGAILHGHLIGELTVHGGGDLTGWKSFLRLIGRPPDEVRSEGGVSRLWAASAARHVEVKEIDYSEVLRERAGRLPAGWDDIIGSCLEGQTPALDERTIRTLLETAKTSEQLSAMMAAIEARVESEGRGLKSRAAALLTLLQTLIGTVQQHDPEALTSSMHEISEAVARLSPEVVLTLLTTAPADQSVAPGLAGAIVDHMSDAAIAGFVARHALSDNTATDRLAQAFHALVRDAEDKERLVSLAHDQVAQSPLGQADGFEQAWDQVAKQLLTSYSDEPYVSDDYARELSGTRSRALAVEQLSDDPPDRLAAWLGTVSTDEVRRLDVALLVDLLRIERDAERRALLAPPTASLLDDLLLLGDFESAGLLLCSAQQHPGPAGQDRLPRELAARLVAGPVVSHIVSHLATIDDGQFEQAKAFCIAVGEALIGPLAEALATEERTRPRERLTAIFMAFGAMGRREVERLKTSQNAAVRRAAVSLLREFGGKEALPELTELLRDSEPQVQREAVKAILNIGTERAYAVLEQALTRGNDQSRESLMQSISIARDERAAPLFAHILGHVDHRGRLRTIYLRSIEALGALGDPAGVPALETALHRGEWWAPGRTTALRTAAAEALARIGTPEAKSALSEAARSGSRGVRSAVKRVWSQS